MFVEHPRPGPTGRQKHEPSIASLNGVVPRTTFAIEHSRDRDRSNTRVREGRAGDAVSARGSRSVRRGCRRHTGGRRGRGRPRAGTGGIRKLRVPLSGRGKRGGARVICYYVVASQFVFLLTAYA